MRYFDRHTINELESLYRINLINSSSGFKSANLIGSRNCAGKSNVAIFSSVIHLGSNPPLLGFIMRPTTVPRNTYENIKETGSYTINHVYKEIIEEAHHSSAKYGAEISEFSVTDLEEYDDDKCFAPFVKNAPVQLQMQFREEHHLQINGTILMIGEVIGIYVKDELLEEDGFVNLSKGNVAALNGLDAYTIPKFETRLPYQRPDMNIQNLKKIQTL